MRSTKKITAYTERRQQVAELYLEGWRQTELAEKFSVTQATISRDLKAIRLQWVESTLINFDEAMARELERIDKLEREYWAAWAESQKDAESSTEETDGAAAIVKITKTKKGQTGNASYLSGIQWCIEQRLKIFGVYDMAKWKAFGDWRNRVQDMGVPEDVADKVFETDVEGMLQLMTVGETAENE